MVRQHLLFDRETNLTNAMTNTFTDWITSVAGIVAAGGVILLWRQLFLLRKQVSHDHERSRRERAIDLFMRWNEFERTGGNLAIAIAELFDSGVAKAVWAGESTALPKKYKGAIDRFLSRQGVKHSLPITNDMVQLTDENSYELRSGMIECMNLMEAILSAARHNVADVDMIKEQFGALIDPDPAHAKTMMRTLREVAGGCN